MNTSQKKVTAILGIDIFVAAGFAHALPKAVGALTLQGTYSRGTLITESSAKTMLDVSWLSARYLFSSKMPDNSEVDSMTLALVTEIAKNYKWTSLVKLVELDGEKAFS